MGIMSGIGGVVGGLSGLFGGGNANSVQAPPSMISPQLQTAAGGNAFNTAANFQNAYGGAGAATMPYAQNIFQSLYGNPYAGQMQSAAGTAAGMGTNAALGAYGAGGNVMNTGQNLSASGMAMLPYAQSIMNTAMDPQNALYGQTAGMTQQQNLANLYNSGLANSPYGQSVMGNAMNNFNIQWQNNQLQRQATGAQAAGGLLGNVGGAVGTGTNAINTGTGIQNTAPGQYLSAASMPYATATTIGQGQQQALNNLQSSYTGAQGIDTATLQNWLGFLGAGNAANQTANQQFQTLLNQNQLANQQNMVFGSSLGGGLAALGRANTSNSPFLGNMSFG